MASSLLRPAYALTMGGQRWTQQAIAIDLTLAAAPGTERLVVRLPAAAPLEAVPDDPVTLTLDGGEGAEPVFGGRITQIRRALDGTTITATGALGLLARLRPATTFENVSAGTVIRSLAADAGVDTGSIEDGVKLAFYAADPSRHAAAHAQRVAGWSGAMLASSGEGALTAVVIDATSPELALRYGREVTGFEASEGLASDRYTVAGESGAGSDSAPEALRYSADPFAGNRPEGPSLGHVWRWEPALRTAAAAATAGAAWQREAGAAQGSAALAAFLLPRLRPGSVIELQDLPDGFGSGPYWVEEVRHRLDATGATTTARLNKGGDAFDPLALLGSLAGGLAGAF